MASVKIEELNRAKTVSGPHRLFSDSFILEFLEPPSALNATVLMRATYASPKSNTLSKMGKKHPQSPPLHLHFDQSETFLVSKGKVGTTEGWTAEDKISVPGDGPMHIPPWIPHSFWPVQDAEEDSTIYVWAHPTNVPEPMDRAFFENLLRYISDCYEQNKMPDLFQIMILQHESATAMVIFPRAWWLGPLRWWIPWKLQAAVAAIGRWIGYRALQEKYMPKEEWEEYLRSKKT